MAPDFSKATKKKMAPKTMDSQNFYGHQKPAWDKLRKSRDHGRTQKGHFGAKIDETHKKSTESRQKKRDRSRQRIRLCHENHQNRDGQSCEKKLNHAKRRGFRTITS